MTRPGCFPLPLCGEWVSMEEDTVVFRLTERFMWCGRGETVIMPAGSTTDFASIPRLFRNLLSPTGRYGWIAVIHDYCYRTGCKSREVADAILLEGMRESGVPAWQCWTVYLAVRLFGWMSYKAAPEHEEMQ